MRRLSQRLVAGTLVVATVAGLILGGCGRSTPPAAPDRPAQQPANQAPGRAEPVQPQETAPQQGPVVGGTFIDTSIADAKVLNPILTSETVEESIVTKVFDALIDFNDKLEPMPALAEDWDVSPDGLVWTFKLRRGVKWHDGEPLTARDVYFTYWAMLHPFYTGVRAGNYNLIKGVPAYRAQWDELSRQLAAEQIDEATYELEVVGLWEKAKEQGGITILGDHELRIALEQPFAPFMAFALGRPIIPEHILGGTEGKAMAEHPFNSKPVGTGRYMFVNWTRDSHIRLTRNPNWWGEPPQIENYVLQIVPELPAAMVALETDEVDRSLVMPESVDWFKNLQHINLLEWMAFNYTYMGYNLREGTLFTDRRVRQALTHAIDRQAMVDAILLGHGALANTHGSPVSWAFNPNSPVFEYDPARARQLLAEAGWSPGPDGILQKDDRRLSFTISTNAGNKIREQAMIIIQQDLSKIGIEVKTEIQEWQALLENIDNGNIDAYIVGWALGFDPDAYQIFHSDGGYNMMHRYKNPELDALIELGRTTIDVEERKPIYYEIQRILAEDQVYTWLFFQNTIVGINKRIHGPITATPRGQDWNMQHWWIPVDMRRP